METKIFSAADLPARVSMGYVGENAFRSLQIDVSAWMTSYPSGVVQAVYQRPDGATYPVTLSQNGTVVGWQPEARDLIAAGYGKLELQIREGEVVGKSAAVGVYISRALEPGEEPEPPSANWLEQVLAAGAAADRVEAAAVHQPIIGESGNWLVWDTDAEEYVDTGVYSGGVAPYIGANGHWYVGDENTGVSAQGPQGEPGQDGAPGTPGSDGEDGADGVTFTPAVSDDGVISWTNDGGRENPTPVNIKGPQGEPGQDGAAGAKGDPGEGVPTGGTAGQVLAKASGDDYDTEWASLPDAVAYTAQSGKSEAQKAQARANIGAGAAEPHPYVYDGVNLKELFGGADALHTALQAEDYSHIHNGDYYPVTFNGTYRDYGEWVALAGTKYYSDTALKVQAGTLDADTVVTYVKASPAYYDITISGTTYHVKMQDCQRWREKTINQNALMEANINVYYQYGDSGVLSGKKPHIMWLARDGIGDFKMRSTNQQWADAVEQFETGDGSTSVFSPDDETLKCVRYVCVDGTLMTYNTAYTVNTSTGAVTFKSGYIPADGADIIISRTTHDCPWVGSAIFQTLNDPDYGLMRLITDTAFAAHILGGDGMRYAVETRTVAGSTSVSWFSRGKGFLPTESEVWGTEVYSTRGNWSHLPQLPIFAKGGRRHLMKGSTNGASRTNWWEASSGSAIDVCHVSNHGYASNNNARSAFALVPGFVTY